MFRNIKQQKYETLRQLGSEFLKRGENIQALLCFDHAFMNPPVLAGLENTEISPILEDYLTYVTLLRDVTSSLDLAKPAIQRLFGIQPASSENMFNVPRGTLLHLVLTNLKNEELALQYDVDSPIVSGQTILATLKSHLWARFVKRIKDENDLCKRTMAFSPCPGYIINESCFLINCQRQHIPYAQLTQDWFTAQLRMHLQQILIFHNLYYAPSVILVQQDRA